MTFVPVKPYRVYTQIVEQVIDLIKTGVFPPGAQLPPERELAQQLGVGRTSVREALSALQMLGVVETKHGQGTFVCKRDISPILQLDAPLLYECEESPFSMLEARKAIEPPIAGLAATRRTEGDLERLRTILDSVWADLEDLEVFGEGDRQFHLGVAQATQNPVLIGVSSTIFQLMGQRLWLKLVRDTHANTPGRWKASMEEHERVYAALRAQSSQLAAARMTEHLDNIEYVMGRDE